VSEKTETTEACIVVYDISGGNVATRFRSDAWDLDYDFITNLQFTA